LFFAFIRSFWGIWADGFMAEQAACPSFGSRCLDWTSYAPPPCPVALQMTAKVVLDIVMISRKIEGENAFLSHEDQSPQQTGSAFVDSLS
jgi:hypothetical protein